MKQIVIDIDDGIYSGIVDGNGDMPRNIVRSFQATIADAIKHGTPLPKGHGRLIDESKIRTINHYHTEKCLVGNFYHDLMFDVETDAPTIIEADKAESEEQTE